MLLENNSEKIVEIVLDFDNLKLVDKLRLSVHLLESSYTNFQRKDIIELLKKELNKLDENSKIIVNFSKYKNLTFIVSKYIELSDKDKINTIIEVLFNIYETDFEDEVINREINNNLPIYNLSYELLETKRG